MGVARFRAFSRQTPCPPPPRRVRFAVKWVGYKDVTWEPAANLAAGSSRLLEVFNEYWQAGNPQPVYVKDLERLSKGKKGKAGKRGKRKKKKTRKRRSRRTTAGGSSSSEGSDRSSEYFFFFFFFFFVVVACCEPIRSAIPAKQRARSITHIRGAVLWPLRA